MGLFAWHRHQLYKTVALNRHTTFCIAHNHSLSHLCIHLFTSAPLWIQRASSEQCTRTLTERNLIIVRIQNLLHSAWTSQYSIDLSMHLPDCFCSVERDLDLVSLRQSRYGLVNVQPSQTQDSLRPNSLQNVTCRQNIQHISQAKERRSTHANPKSYKLQCVFSVS